MANNEKSLPIHYLWAAPHFIDLDHISPQPLIFENDCLDWFSVKSIPLLCSNSLFCPLSSAGVAGSWGWWWGWGAGGLSMLWLLPPRSSIPAGMWEIFPARRWGVDSPSQNVIRVYTFHAKKELVHKATRLSLFHFCLPWYCNFIYLLVDLLWGDSYHFKKSLLCKILNTLM